MQKQTNKKNITKRMHLIPAEDMTAGMVQVHEDVSFPRMQ